MRLLYISTGRFSKKKHRFHHPMAIGIASCLALVLKNDEVIFVHSDGRTTVKVLELWILTTMVILIPNLNPLRLSEETIAALTCLNRSTKQSHMKNWEELVKELNVMANLCTVMGQLPTRRSITRNRNRLLIGKSPYMMKVRCETQAKDSLVITELVKGTLLKDRLSSG